MRPLQSPRSTLVCASLLLVTQWAIASVDDWQVAPYPYLVIDQDVRGVLNEFGRNLDIPVVLSGTVKGRVRGRVVEDNAREFLARVTTANGLTWYYDSHALYIDSEQDMGSQSFDTHALDRRSIERLLDGLKIVGQRISVQLNPQQNVVTVSGPPGYRTLVEQLLASLRPLPAVTEQGVRVFRGGSETVRVTGTRS
ncbi:type III secretion protein [Pseudomonas koreensis]|uniref:type III secretion protein n=1 Tax=Pseudomonas koreensis TaxID=198620 RepID=UPI002FC9B4E6